MAKRKTAAKQTKRSSRWITVREPFNFTWPSRAITHFHTPGPYCVKNEVADFAVGKGYASEGKDETADARSVPPMGDANAADADRSADRPAVDPDAG